MTTQRVFEPTGPVQSPVTVRAYGRVGGWLGERIFQAMDVIRIARKGVPTSAVDALLGLGLTKGEINWVINPRTLRDRKHRKQPLTTDESDRWLRAAKVVALAEEVFANDQKALRWLHTPRKALGGESPMALIETEAGAQLVEQTLITLDAGHFA